MDSYKKTHPLSYVEHHNFLEHIIDVLPSVKAEPSIKILEVGCGKGALSKLFMEHVTETKFPTKIEYVAVDPLIKSEKITYGENTLEFVDRDFLDFSAPDSAFSIILFGFSLHHIDMPRAMEKSKALLASNGILIVQDFAREKITEENETWLFDISDILRVAGINEDVKKYTGPSHYSQPEASHHHHHHHAEGHSHHASHEHSHSHGHSHGEHSHGEHKHTDHSESFMEDRRSFNRPGMPKSDEIINNIKAYFKIDEEIHRGPFLYRCACKGLEKSDRGAAVGMEILKKENEKIKKGLMYPFSFRIVARK
eukprot:TRINITY_DN1353_c0_g2_i2.p1 TRINITY_DN1353_c0_g2~~TRINITY_DN1353_c0_g2_i2.p1  ORF type:complete len:310 (-),score=41.66 TRINITY_DN1353_c0_g2_i2:79-1008(-)